MARAPGARRECASHDHDHDHDHDFGQGHVVHVLDDVVVVRAEHDALDERTRPMEFCTPAIGDAEALSPP
jgi:hypothetical protein